MKYITFIRLFTRLLFLGLIFILIKSSDDYLLYPMLNGFGAFLSGFIALYIIFKREKIQFIIPSYHNLKYSFIESFTIFSTKVSYYLRDHSVIIIVGVLFSKTIVAYYDLANKIIGIFTSMYQIIPTVVLPRLAQKKSVAFSRFIFRLTVLLSSIYCICVFIFSKWIVLLLGGEQMLFSIPVLRVLIILALFFPINILLNYYLILKENTKSMLKSTFISLIVFILLLPALFLLPSIYTLILIFVLSVIIELLYKIYLFRRDKEFWIWIT